MYPEYYILRVNDFDQWSKVPLEQWIYFLNTGEIPNDATAPGLVEGREEGRREERILMAKKMLADGMALDVIVKYTNFTIEEIQKL